MKLYPLLPLIFIAAYIFVGISIAISTPRYAVDRYWLVFTVFIADLFYGTQTDEKTKDLKWIFPIS